MARHRVVALIPARGGSKRLPGKNVRLLGGRPLIAYTIVAALASEEISDVIVSTDDQATADVARELGANVPFLRPEDISGDDARTEDVALHLLSFLDAAGDSPDVIAVLQPTSPLRTATHINEAVRQLYDSAASSLVSVVSLGVPRSHLRWVEGDMATTPAGPPGEAYRLNGAIYLVRAGLLQETGELSPAPVAAYVMDSDVSLDIDTLDDFGQAERLLEKVGS